MERDKEVSILAIPVEKGLSKSRVKNSSQGSIKTRKRVGRAPLPPQLFTHSTVAAFQEITRLISVNDEQSSHFAKLKEENKTLRITKVRLEKALVVCDKQQIQFPKLFDQMAAQIRVLRTERDSTVSKLNVCERQAIANSNLLQKSKFDMRDLQERLNILSNLDISKLSSEVGLKDKLLNTANEEIKELNGLLRDLATTHHRDLLVSKQRMNKLVKELEKGRIEATRLNAEIKRKPTAVVAVKPHRKLKQAIKIPPRALPVKDEESSVHQDEESLIEIPLNVESDSISGASLLIETNAPSPALRSPQISTKNSPKNTFFKPDMDLALYSDDFDE